MFSHLQMSNELVPEEAEWRQPSATELAGAPMACWRCTLAIECVRPSHAGLYTLRVHSYSHSHSALSRTARASDDQSQSAAGGDAAAASAPEAAPGAAETACLLAVVSAELPHSSTPTHSTSANADAELRAQSGPDGAGQADAFLAGEPPSQI